MGRTVDSDLALFQRHLAQARNEIEELIPANSFGITSADRDKTEGKVARVLYRAINSVPPPANALDTPDFWTWVTMAYCWNFAVWRESSAFLPFMGLADEEQPASNSQVPFVAYIDGRRREQCVGFRLYLRIQCLGGQEHDELADAVTDGTDFWRSAILRGVIGEHPAAVRKMVALQAAPETRLTTERLREFSIALRRQVYNYELATLADIEQARTIEELWSAYHRSAEAAD